MKTKITLTLLLALSLVACKSNGKKDAQNAEKAQPSYSHNSQNALDWAGTYKGILPCADCPGIATTIVLHKDMTYEKNVKYLERNASFKQKGSFKWNGEGNQITLYKNGETKTGIYSVGENKLTQLDGDGNRIEGDIAVKFILTKTPSNN